MNEIAKELWDLSVQWLDAADHADDINTTIAYTGMSEIALQQAQFAVNNPTLVMGQDELPLPPGVTVAPPLPPGPTQGPRVWGAPT
jgi:hypothetical protein